MVLNFRVIFFFDTQLVFSSLSNLSYICVQERELKFQLEHGRKSFSFRINPLGSKVHKYNVESTWGWGRHDF